MSLERRIAQVEASAAGLAGYGATRKFAQELEGAGVAVWGTIGKDMVRLVGEAPDDASWDDLLKRLRAITGPLHQRYPKVVLMVARRFTCDDAPRFLRAADLAEQRKRAAFTSRNLVEVGATPVTPEVSAADAVRPGENPAPPATAAELHRAIVARDQELAKVRAELERLQREAIEAAREERKERERIRLYGVPVATVGALG